MLYREWETRGGRNGAEFTSGPFLVRWSPPHWRWMLLKCHDMDAPVREYRQVGTQLYTSSRAAKAAAGEP